MTGPARPQAATPDPRGRLWAFEPWYLAFALLAATTTGIIPILVPIEVIGLQGDPRDVGLVLSAMGLGMLTAPWWGGLADRRRWHRPICCGGALLVALAQVGLAFIREEDFWIALTFLSGVGVAAAFTVSNLFIVEAHPQDEWNARIGWLQTITTGGTVFGLVLAGVVDRLPLEVGFLFGTALAALAAVLCWLTTRTPARPDSAGPSPPNLARRIELLHLEILELGRQPAATSFRRLAQSLFASINQPFGTFLAAWLLSMLGMSAVNGLYPLLMLNVFKVPSEVASVTLAAATALGLTLYSPAGLLIARYTPPRVLQAGLAVRLAALVALVVLGATALGGREGLAILAVALVTLTWPILSVVSTVLPPLLLPNESGEAMGSYNASAAVAGLLGPTIGGWVALEAGYDSVWLLGAVGVGLGLAISFFLSRTAR